MKWADDGKSLSVEIKNNLQGDVLVFVDRLAPSFPLQIFNHEGESIYNDRGMNIISDVCLIHRKNAETKKWTVPETYVFKLIVFERQDIPLKELHATGKMVELKIRYCLLSDLVSEETRETTSFGELVGKRFKTYTCKVPL